MLAFLCGQAVEALPLLQVLVVLQLAIEGGQLWDLTGVFVGALSEFAAIERNGACFHGGFNFFLVGTDGHVLNPKRILLLGGGFEEGSGIHGDAADSGPPGIFMDLGILN